MAWRGRDGCARRRRRRSARLRAARCSNWPGRTAYLMREAIRSHQRPSEVIRGHQWSLGSIRGHERPSVVIKRSSGVIGGHQASYEAIRCSISLGHSTYRHVARCPCSGQTPAAAGPAAAAGPSSRWRPSCPGAGVHRRLIPRAAAEGRGRRAGRGRRSASLQAPAVRLIQSPPQCRRSARLIFHSCRRRRRRHRRHLNRRR